jgi:hypothetical protein
VASGSSPGPPAPQEATSSSRIVCEPESSRATVSGNHVRLGQPPQAARTAGPPERGQADESIARSASTRPVRSTPPEGVLSWRYALDHPGRGTPPQRVGNDVGSSRPGPRTAGAGPAGLRSLPAKQHAPKCVPPPATDRGRHAGVAAVVVVTSTASIGPRSVAVIAGPVNFRELEPQPKLYPGGRRSGRSAAATAHLEQGRRAADVGDAGCRHPPTFGACRGLPWRTWLTAHSRA